MSAVPKPAPRAPKAKRPPTQRNAARRTRRFRASYHSLARVRYVTALPCAVQNALCYGAVENAHNGDTGGTGIKGSFRDVVPLCTLHHRMLHTMGRTSFERLYALDLTATAAETEMRWATSET